jgi:hypothetical protein
MATKMVMRVNPIKLRRVIETDKRYQAYSFRVASRIKAAAISVFNVRQRKDNEWRLSNTTPPKYIASFRIEWHRVMLRHYVINDDPGWHWVEYGTHPGGNPNNFVMRYRPLGRALDIVAATSGSDI